MNDFTGKRYVKIFFDLLGNKLAFQPLLESVMKIGFCWIFDCCTIWKRKIFKQSLAKASYSEPRITFLIGRLTFSQTRTGPEVLAPGKLENYPDLVRTRRFGTQIRLGLFFLLLKFKYRFRFRGKSGWIVFSEILFLLYFCSLTIHRKWSVPQFESNMNSATNLKYQREIF